MPELTVADYHAQAKTALLFEVFWLTQIPKLPVHAESGLPKIDTCYGFADVWDKLFECGAFRPPFDLYLAALARERNVSLSVVTTIFLEAWRAPANATEKVRALPFVRLHIAEMQRRHFKPGLSLDATTGAPIVEAAWLAYAAVQRWRQTTSTLSK